MLRNKSILQHKDDDAHNLFNLAYHRIALTLTRFTTHYKDVTSAVHYSLATPKSGFAANNF